MDARSIAMTVHGIARLGLNERDFMGMLAERTLSYDVLENINAQAIANISWASPHPY